METNSGIYDYTRNLLQVHNENRIEGFGDAMIVGLFDGTPSEEAKNALVKSAASLGWNESSVSFVSSDGLSETDLLELVEGIDPLAVVLAGEDSARLFFRTYRIEETRSCSFRALCREIRLIPRFETLMKTLNGKQEIWSVLKTLPQSQ